MTDRSFEFKCVVLLIIIALRVSYIQHRVDTLVSRVTQLEAKTP